MKEPPQGWHLFVVRGLTMEQARGLCRPCNECHPVGAEVDCYGVERIVLVSGDSGGRNERNLVWCHASEGRCGVTIDLTDPTAVNSRIWQHLFVAILRVSGTAP